MRSLKLFQNLKIEQCKSNSNKKQLFECLNFLQLFYRLNPRSTPFIPRPTLKNFSSTSLFLSITQNRPYEIHLHAYIKLSQNQSHLLKLVKCQQNQYALVPFLSDLIYLLILYFKLSI